MKEKQTSGNQIAILTCVTPPDKNREQGLRRFLEKKYGKVDLQIVQDPSLKGGFCLKVGADVYDWSVKGRIAQLRDGLKASGQYGQDVVPMLLKNIRDFELSVKDTDEGIVISIGDGIAMLKGLEYATYGEIIRFESGATGMVQDLKKDTVGCILFDGEDGVQEGHKAVRTGKTAGMPVGDKFIGRVINALGEPIDGLGDIEAEGYNVVEKPAPGIIDRQPVVTPLETGILAIDAMFPIGRGQRELIIGDRQTGKTSIAIDTIINQKGKNVVCIYVAIGQKASSIAHTVETLRRYGAMEYTSVVAATASDSAPLQYIAPYSGTALAEYFMDTGRDVLIVYDDLSKHAVAYRTLSLLLGRSPGREAYPGDVFYLHSRLLERSAHLSEEKGGGSITALPIVETQAGDVSAYIPTNIISITDGQIFLESNLFFAGQRPAVNVGLSVSRVGGAAQSKVLRKSTGTLRLDLAQYREMEVFTQFSSDLDETTKQQLLYGQGLMQLLRQKNHYSMSMPDQVITLIAAMNRVFVPVPTKDITGRRDDILEYMHAKHPEIIKEIESGVNPDDRLKLEILGAIAEMATH